MGIVNCWLCITFSINHATLGHEKAKTATTARRKVSVTFMNVTLTVPLAVVAAFAFLVSKGRKVDRECSAQPAGDYPDVEAIVPRLASDPSPMPVNT